MMLRAKSGFSRARKGISFLEMLMAVALIGFVLASGSSFLFSLMQVWGNLDDKPAFDRHADGVVSFLQQCLDQSANLSGNDVRPVKWQTPPRGENPLIHFKVEGKYPIFVADFKPMPDVFAFIDFDEEEGLSLLWYLEGDRESRRALLKTPLSNKVLDFEYAYYSEETEEWEHFSASEPSGVDYETLPSHLRITFLDRGKERKYDLRMSKALRTVLMY